MGVIFVYFTILVLPYLQKFALRENKTHMTLLRRIEYYPENYPHGKGLAIICAKKNPQRK